MKNNKITEIKNYIENQKMALIFPHIHADGDAVGSAVALCIGLRKLNLNAHVVIEDKIANYLTFLTDGLLISLDDAIKICQEQNNDFISISVDCGSDDRFPKRAELFHKGNYTICIDHHGTTVPNHDFDYIVPEAGATGELVYEVLQVIGVSIDKDIARALFVAITTDTGNFQYSNTSKNTHEIMASLYDSGADFNDASVRIYETEPICKIKLQSKIIAESQIIANGNAIIATVMLKDLKEFNALNEHTEGIVAKLRAISGIRISALIKEQEDGTFKVSLRSKDSSDVSRISKNMSAIGGGHKKAAGFSYEGELITLVSKLSSEIEKEFKRLKHK